MDAIVQAKRVLEIFKEMSQIPRDLAMKRALAITLSILLTI